MSPKCTHFWIIPSHLVPMNSVWIPPCCSISISNYSACSVKTLTFSWPPISSPCPPEVDSLSFFKSFWNVPCTFLCYGHSPLSPSCQDYCNYSLTGFPDSVFFFIPSNLLHQAHCSDTLLLPCHSLSPKKNKKKSPTELLLLSITYNSKSNLLILACKVPPRPHAQLVHICPSPYSFTPLYVSSILSCHILFSTMQINHTMLTATPIYVFTSLLPYPNIRFTSTLQNVLEVSFPCNDFFDQLSPYWFLFPPSSLPMYVP